MALNYLPDYVGQLGDRQKALVFTGRAGNASPTANVTTNYRISTPPGGSCVLIAASVYQVTVVADADGTVLATVQKRRGSDDTLVDLSSALDLEVGTAYEQQNFTLNAATADLTFAAIDALNVKVVNNSAAIDTAAVDMTFNFVFAYTA